MTAYLSRTIKEIHAALVDGQVTPADLVHEAQERIEKDPCNAFEAKAYQSALAQAQKIVGVLPNDYLRGIPYLVKDNYSTKGLETTGSSDILSGYVPSFDAEVVRRLNKAGGLLLAKTTLDEMAMGGTGTTGHKGATTNPYDRERIVGGSSCGSAAAVALGMAPFSLGSDTGDSVRKPASYAGLVGFKPSWGLISRYGLLPFATSLDTVGYLTRCVWDSALLTGVLIGHDSKDMSSVKGPKKDYVKTVERKDTLKTICYIPAIVEACQPYVKAAFNKILDGLKGKGYTVQAYDFPLALLDAIYPAYMLISCAEATANNAQYDGLRYGPAAPKPAATFAEFMTAVRTAGFGDLIKRRFVIGSFSLLAANKEDMFQRAQKARRLIVNELNEMFAHADYLLLPAAPSIPGYLKEVKTAWDTEPKFAENHLCLGNFGGMPSLTLPLGLEQGVPFGLNATGRVFQDEKVLALGADIEELTGLYNLQVKEGQ